MAESKRFHEIFKKFNGDVDFAFVYIEEAHPTGTMNLKNQIFINAHKTIDERVSAANQLKSHYPDVPVYIDPLDNTISRSFGAYPERLYILLDNVILYDGNVGPFFYSLSAVEDWIVNYVEKQ